MQLYFIRHGESINNSIWNQTGSNNGRSEDPELTEKGHQQATFLAKFIKKPTRTNLNIRHDLWNYEGFGITHLYSSLMVRAALTGYIVANELEIPLTGWTELHEHGGIVEQAKENGEWVGLPGKNRSYFEQNFPLMHLPVGLDENGWWGNRPYESSNDALERAHGVLKDLIIKHGDTDDRVAVVSHSGFFNFLMMTILDLEKPGTSWIELNNTSISRIDIFKDKDGQLKKIIKYLNRLDFLPAELVTPRPNI
jgi:2,3-bisphosphoglycerate-dependent phosphoglycerate mutase